MDAVLSPLASRVADACPWLEGVRVLAACSGGPDSTALVLVLDELRRAGRLELAVGHVHHGLRTRAADTEGDGVRILAERLGVPHHERRRDAAAERTLRRKGLEEAARTVRREALAEMSAEARCDLIALAHAADDQAETLLLRLVRGAGPEGLSGMAAHAPPFIRPLLGLRRRELRDHLRAALVPWASDPTNWGPTSARSLVREMLERIEVTLNDRAVERLCETADLLRAEAAHLEAEVDGAAARSLRVASEDGGGPRAAALDTAALRGLPPPLARRLARRFLRAARPDLPPPSLDAVARVLALAGGRGGPAAAHVAGTVVRRSGQRLVTAAAPTTAAPREPIPIAVPGRTRWGAGVVVATVTPEDVATVTPEDVATVTRDARRGPPLVRHDAADGLVARGRRPGDVMPFRGVNRHVGKLMRELGVPADERDRLPVVGLAPRGDTIVSIAGLAVADPFAARPGTGGGVRLEWRADGATFRA